MADHASAPAAQSKATAEIDRAAAAKYVADMIAELAVLARRHRLDTLSYILDMAQLEADNVNRHVNGRR